MPANKEARLLPSPWREFLAELDGMLHESLELHCIVGFVFTYFYGLPRTTGDIDYYTAIPANLFTRNMEFGFTVWPLQTFRKITPAGSLT